MFTSAKLILKRKERGVAKSVHNMKNLAKCYDAVILGELTLKWMIGWLH